MLHLEIFTEDISGARQVELLLEKLGGFDYEIHRFKGCGALPKNGADVTKIKSQMLLNSLPKLMLGFTNTYRDTPDDSYRMIVVVDCDNRDKADFKRELVGAIRTYVPDDEQRIRVCIAVEEMEAWLLSDFDAIAAAYPNADREIYDTYEQDSICGTWEVLARVIDRAGYELLKNAPYYVKGGKKYEWAENITPHLPVKNVRSPSLEYFLKTVRG